MYISTFLAEPPGGAITIHCKDAGQLPAASAEQPEQPIRLPLTQGPCWHIPNRSWTADGAEKMAQHTRHEKEALNC